MASSRLPIPQDIIQVILHHLRGDNTTLTICASVSHTFLHLSRSHLFFSVHISRPLPLRRLSALLTQKPEIALFIRQLFLVDHDTDPVSWWYRSGRRLLNVLRVVHRLQQLSLSRSHSTWGGFSAEIQSALIDRFRDPHLEAVHISQMLALPLTMMTNFVNLKKLRLAVELVDDSSDGTFSFNESALTFTRLTALDLSILDNALISDVDKMVLRMTNVQLLCIRNNNEVTLDVAQKVIDSSARSLKCFIWAHEDRNGWPPPIGSIRNLELLFFTMTQYRHPEEETQWIPDYGFGIELFSLIQLFQHNAVPSNLKELIISASWSPIFETWEEAVMRISTRYAWADLDAVLSNHPTLERVLLLVDSSRRIVEDELLLQTQVSLRMPFLSKRGIFEACPGLIDDMHDRVWSEY